MGSRDPHREHLICFPTWTGCCANASSRSWCRGTVGPSIQIKIGDLVSYNSGIGVSPIAQHHHRQLVIKVTRNVSFEALPGAAVIEHSMTTFGLNEPCETVVAGVGLAIRQ